MKIMGLRMLLVLSLLLGLGASSSASVESASVTPSPNIRIEEWAGHSFTFLALPADKQAAGYEIFKVDQATKGFAKDPSVRIPYAEHVGKQVTVNQIVSFPAGDDLTEFLVYMTVNDTNEKLVGKTMREQLDGLILTADLKNARQQFLGKTIYPKYRALSGLYLPGINETPMPVTIPIASAVTVVDVYAGNQIREPIWLIVSVNGEKAMLPISYSWTNVSVNQWTETIPWQYDLFTENPRSTLGWSQDIWKNIEMGTVEIGMTPEQIRLSWGKPTSVDEKTNHWIYGSKKLHFSKNVLHSIDIIN